MLKQRDHRIDNCIQLCQECQQVCQETFFEHCLSMGGKHVEKEHAKLMADCIEACQTAANFMQRGSRFHSSECAACAEICDACAESCGRIGGEEMARCADICRRCAQSCRDMGNMRKAA